MDTTSLNLVDDVPLSGRIVHRAHVLPVRVHWEDTDAGGIVYHASHLVARMEIDYRAPGLFDMALHVLTTVVRLGAARLELQQVISNGSEVLADAFVRCAGIGSDGKPRAAPEPVRAAFAPMLK